MTWYAIVEKKTGRLVSKATVIADKAVLAVLGLEAITLKDDPGRCEWDEATRTFLPEVLKTNMPTKQEVTQRLMSAMEDLKAEKLKVPDGKL